MDLTEHYDWRATYCEKEPMGSPSLVRVTQKTEEKNENLGNAWKRSTNPTHTHRSHGTSSLGVNSFYCKCGEEFSRCKVQERRRVLSRIKKKCIVACFIWLNCFSKHRPLQPNFKKSLRQQVLNGFYIFFCWCNKIPPMCNKV